LAQRPKVKTYFRPIERYLPIAGKAGDRQRKEQRNGAQEDARGRW
jgi:hypothetical protein